MENGLEEVPFPTDLKPPITGIPKEKKSSW